MPESFDPYRVWLSIPPESRPPTHYQLLGISPDERDPTVINAAVLRQSAYVRNYQIGKYAEEAAQILNEIQAAKLCLLDPAKRARYDAEHGATRGGNTQLSQPAASDAAPLYAVPAPAIDLESLASAAPAAPAVRGGAHGHRAGMTLNKSRKNASRAWQLPAAVFGGVMIVAALIAFGLPRPEPSELDQDRSAETFDLAGGQEPQSPTQPSSVGRGGPPPGPDSDDAFRRPEGPASESEAGAPAETAPPLAATRDRSKDWSYGYVKRGEESAAHFGYLPYFDGSTSTWKGRVELPDPQLGWAFLDSTGGHPSDRYDVVRRWTASADGYVEIRGKLSHGPETYSDGVRGRVFTGRGGLQGEWVIKNGQVITEIDGLTVAVGETIDFAVDCVGGDGQDRFAWPVTIELNDQSDKTVGAWDSVADFAGPHSARSPTVADATSRSEPE